MPAIYIQPRFFQCLFVLLLNFKLLMYELAIYISLRFGLKNFAFTSAHVDDPTVIKRLRMRRIQSQFVFDFYRTLRFCPLTGLKKE